MPDQPEHALFKIQLLFIIEINKQTIISDPYFIILIISSFLMHATVLLHISNYFIINAYD